MDCGSCRTFKSIGSLVNPPSGVILPAEGFTQYFHFLEKVEKDNRKLPLYSCCTLTTGTSSLITDVFVPFSRKKNSITN